MCSFKVFAISDIAINVNIAIMRTFALVRRSLIENNEFNRKLEELESKYDKQFGDVNEALNYLIKKDTLDEMQKKRKQIGFKE